MTPDVWIVDPVILLAFVPAAVALNLTPGADMLFCLAMGLRAGLVPAIAASAGISAACLVTTGVAGAGLGALFAAMPQVFDVIRWIGVVYLLVLAWRTLHAPLALKDGVPVRPARAFRDGFVVNLTNPKVILFILAFVPQFVDPARGAVLLQFLIFGAVIAGGGFVINAGVGIFAGRLGRAMARTPAIDRVLRAASASVFGLLALKLVLETRRT